MILSRYSSKGGTPEIKIVKKIFSCSVRQWEGTAISHNTIFQFLHPLVIFVLGFYWARSVSLANRRFSVFFCVCDSAALEMCSGIILGFGCILYNIVQK